MGGLIAAGCDSTRSSVDRGLVTITRDENDRSNLPPGRGHAIPMPRPAARRSRADRSTRWISSIAISADVEINAAGRADRSRLRTGEAPSAHSRIERGVEVRTRAQRVTIDPVKGQMAFDGSNVELADVGLTTSDGTFLSWTGQIDRALDQPTLNLQFKRHDGSARSPSDGRRPPVACRARRRLTPTMTGAPSQFVLDASSDDQGLDGWDGEGRGHRRAGAADAQRRDRFALDHRSRRPAARSRPQPTSALVSRRPGGWLRPGVVSTPQRHSGSPMCVRWPFGAALTGKARIDRAPASRSVWRPTTSQPRGSPAGTAPRRRSGGLPRRTGSLASGSASSSGRRPRLTAHRR